MTIPTFACEKCIFISLSGQKIKEFYWVLEFVISGRLRAIDIVSECCVPLNVEALNSRMMVLVGGIIGVFIK